MRLLHTTKFTFKEFIGQNIPPYAILSHRWSEQEVSHQDFLASKQSPLQRKSEGYGWLKIPKGCQIAVQDGFEWMWIDTCCIDKKSSAELSEAINSMFAWYRGSKICYVFHPDVHATGGFNYGPNEPEFRGSSWFTRAWTYDLLEPYGLDITLTIYVDCKNL